MRRFEPLVYFGRLDRTHYGVPHWGLLEVEAGE